MLLYFTGSKQFNIDMRNWALKKGFSLNEYSLTELKTKKKIYLNTEEDIFSFLNIKYVLP